MEWDDDMVVEVVKNYSLLASYIKELEAVRESKDGACLNYIAGFYSPAFEALELLEARLPEPLQAKLGLERLATRLESLGNVNVRL